jgi:hypothetical protein
LFVGKACGVFAFRARMANERADEQEVIALVRSGSPPAVELVLVGLQLPRILPPFKTSDFVVVRAIHLPPKAVADAESIGAHWKSLNNR